MEIARRPRDDDRGAPPPGPEEALDDAVLVARAKEGDREAFGTIVDRYKDAVVNYLARLTGSVDRAQDLGQETFLKLYAALPRYEERGQLAALIYRIATNLVRSEKRRERKVRFFSLESKNHDRVVEPAAQRKVLTGELVDHVGRAVAELPTDFRVPLVLHELEGFTVPQIASMTGTREGTIKSRINRARARLRDRLEPYWNGDPR